MAPKENSFSIEKVDHLDYNDAAIEPVVFVPPIVSTISINDLPSYEKLSWVTRFSGILYALTSSLCFTCAAFSIKQLGVDLLDAVLFRMILQTLMTFVFISYKHYPLYPTSMAQLFLQIVCCGTGTGVFFLYFFAIRYVELSDVTTLCYTKVVWTVIFSLFIYHERPSISLLIALPLTLIGVVFVTQPTFLFSSTIPSITIVNNKFRILGLTLSILASFSSATNVLSFKQLISTSKGIKPSVINFYYCFAVLIFLIINQFYQKFVLHTGLSLNEIFSWKYLIASFICLAMILSNILTQKAIKREHPAVFTLLGSSDIIFALILQNIFTSKRSNLFALLGSALVIGSVMIIGLSKILNDKRQIKSINDQTLIKNVEEKC